MFTNNLYISYIVYYSFRGWGQILNGDAEIEKIFPLPTPVMVECCNAGGGQAAPAA